MSKSTDVKKEVETVEVDDSFVEKVAESIAPQVSESLKGVVSEAIASSMESTKKKEVNGGTSKKEANKTGEKKVKAPFEKESAALRLVKQVQAKKNGDWNTLRKYNEYAMELRHKAGYANTDTDADGGYLVPDPEFDTTVNENLPNYGVTFQFADVRQTDRNAIKLLSLVNELEFVKTDEAGVKSSGKLNFNRKTVDLDKYALIVPSTDELTEDAAIDFWNTVTQELSRAMSKKADQITFTDADSGITNTAGVITTPVSGAGTTISWNDLLGSEGKLEDTDTSSARWFMRKETWYRLVQQRADSGESSGDGAGVYLFQPNPNNPTTPWGTPVSFTRVLESSASVGANDALAVYGDLRNYRFVQKRGLQLTVLNEATIKDADNSDLNLATQDATALRAVTRMLGAIAHANAGKFVVVGTGTVS